MEDIPETFMKVYLNNADKEIKLICRNENFRILKYYLYEILNKFEDSYSIFVYNIPYCLAPDAYDHIIYSRNKNKKYKRIDICYSCRLFELCPGIEQKSILLNKEYKSKLAPVLNVPNEIVLEITRKCPLNCHVCFYKKDYDPPTTLPKKDYDPPATILALRQGTSEDLSFESVENVLKEAKELDIKNIRFTGGEPFLNKDFIKMLKFAKENDFYVLVNTTGTIGSISELRHACQYMDNVLVSLQGYNPATEGILTGRKDLFEIKIKNMNLFKKHVSTLRCGTIISKILLNNFNKYIALIKNINPDSWELYRPIFKQDISDNYSITPNDMKRLAKVIFSIKNFRTKILIGNPVPLCLVPKKHRYMFLGGRYEEGNTRMVCDTEGFLKPNYYVNRRLANTIKSAWQNRFIKDLYSRRNFLQMCRNCRYLLRCMGGGRFISTVIRPKRVSLGKDPWLNSIGLRSK